MSKTRRTKREFNKDHEKGEQILKPFMERLIDSFFRLVLCVDEDPRTYDEIFEDFDNRYRQKIKEIKHRTQVGFDPNYFTKQFRQLR